MAFMGAKKEGYVFNAGQFLAHEECTRETREALQSLATEVDGAKYIKAGTPYPSNDGNCIGLIYEDTDVTVGNMPCSVVTKGEVIEAKLPVALEEAAKTALVAKGFKFVIEGAVTRPDWSK